MARKNTQIKYSTAILRYPSGRFGIVGSVPMELTEVKKSGYLDSKVWGTEQEVIDALLAIGMTDFQLSDCTWYVPQTENDIILSNRDF